MTYLKNKEKYLNLINDLLSGKIKTDRFIRDFMDSWRVDRDCDTDEIYNKSKDDCSHNDFLEMLDNIFSSCDVCNIDEKDFDSNCEITEKQFIDEVKSSLENYMDY
jgi:hypothetical protein